MTELDFYKYSALYDAFVKAAHLYLVEHNMDLDPKEIVVLSVLNSGAGMVRINWITNESANNEHPEYNSNVISVPVLCKYS